MEKSWGAKLRGLSSKGPHTKVGVLKSLCKEIQQVKQYFEECEESEEDKISSSFTPIIETWTHEYRDLVRDSDAKVRKKAHATMGLLANFIDSGRDQERLLFGPWWFSQFETSELAKSSLEPVFVEGKVNLISHMDEIFSYIGENLKLKLEDMPGQLTISKKEIEKMRQQVISSSFRALESIFDSLVLPSQALDNIDLGARAAAIKKTESLLSDEKIYELLVNPQRRTIAVAACSALEKLIHAAFDIKSFKNLCHPLLLQCKNVAETFVEEVEEKVNPALVNKLYCTFPYCEYHVKGTKGDGHIKEEDQNEDLYWHGLFQNDSQADKVGVLDLDGTIDKSGPWLLDNSAIFTSQRRNLDEFVRYIFSKHASHFKMTSTEYFELVKPLFEESGVRGLLKHMNKVIAESHSDEISELRGEPDFVGLRATLIHKVVQEYFDEQYHEVGIYPVLHVDHTKKGLENILCEVSIEFNVETKKPVVSDNPLKKWVFGRVSGMDMDMRTAESDETRIYFYSPTLAKLIPGRTKKRKPASGEGSSKKK